MELVTTGINYCVNGVIRCRWKVCSVAASLWEGPWLKSYSVKFKLKLIAIIS